MKKFLTKLYSFLFPLLVSGLLLELLIRSIPNDYLFKRKMIESGADDIAVLVLGTSHAWEGVNPAFFTLRTFNAGHAAQSVDIDLALFRRFSSHLSNLKAILLPIDYPSLIFRTSTSSDDWRMKNYHLYYGLRTTFDPKHYSEILSVRFKTNVIRVYKHYLQGKSFVFSDSSGFYIKEGYVEDLKTSGVRDATLHSQLDLSMMQENLKCLQEFIHEAKARDIVVLFYSSPMSNQYRSRLDEKQLNLTYQMVERLVEEDHVFYRDFLDDPRFTDADFRNATHLNGTGAKKLSELLNRELELIVSINKHSK